MQEQVIKKNLSISMGGFVLFSVYILLHLYLVTI